MEHGLAQDHCVESLRNHTVCCDNVVLPCFRPGSCGVVQVGSGQLHLQRKKGTGAR